MIRPFLLAASLLTAPSIAATEMPKRVVAAGGIITEIIHALGRQHTLVGVDSTSLFPPEALKQWPGIGYVRALSAEGILALQPDLVMAIEGAGPPAVLDQIRSAGVEITAIPEAFTEAEIANRIRQIGTALGAEREAEHLAAGMEADFAVLAKQRAEIAKPKRVLFVLSMQNGRVMAGGRGSSADAIIRLAGGINAASTIEGFKPLSDEGLIAAAPDVIVMMQHGNHATSAQDVFGHPALGAVPAAATRSLVSMDGLLLLGFGPRTPEAAQRLLVAIYGHGNHLANRKATP